MARTELPLLSTLIEPMQRIPVGVIPELRRVNLANGKQARVVRIADYPGADKECVAKFCGGEHKGYTWDEARMLVDETIAYRNELQKAGVVIPKNHRINAVQVEAGGSYQIVMIDEMHGDGEDLKSKLSNGYALDYKRWISLKILEFLDRLPGGRVESPLITCPTEVLGDFKPDNWVLDGNDMILIDYFGPKRWKDGLAAPYLKKMDSLLTQQAITFLCGDRRGQFSRVMAMMARNWPEIAPYAIDVGLAMLKHNHPEAYDWVKNEVEHRFDRINQVYQMRPSATDAM